MFNILIVVGLIIGISTVCALIIYVTTSRFISESRQSASSIILSNSVIFALFSYTNTDMSSFGPNLLDGNILCIATALLSPPLIISFLNRSK